MNVKSAQRDEEGYVINPGDWSRDLALALAREEELSLTDEHWIVITFVRDYHAEHGITPEHVHVDMCDPAPPLTLGVRPAP